MCTFWGGSKPAFLHMDIAWVSGVFYNVAHNFLDLALREFYVVTIILSEDSE